MVNISSASSSQQKTKKSKLSFNEEEFLGHHGCKIWNMSDNKLAGSDSTRTGTNSEGNSGREKKIVMKKISNLKQEADFSLENDQVNSLTIDRLYSQSTFGIPYLTCQKIEPPLKIKIIFVQNKISSWKKYPMRSVLLKILS